MTAFFSVYSSAFANELDVLEIYRYFRSTEFSDFDHFIVEFLAQPLALYEIRISGSLQNFDPDLYLIEFFFHSTNDGLRRCLRDEILSNTEYKVDWWNNRRLHSSLACQALEGFAQAQYAFLSRGLQPV